MSRLPDANQLPTLETRLSQAQLLSEQCQIPISRILVLCAVSRKSFEEARRRQGWRHRRRRASPANRLAVMDEKKGPVRQDGSEQPARSSQQVVESTAFQSMPLERRRALIARSWALAEAQCAELERRMSRLVAGELISASPEREARAMASLVRALKELATLDAFGIGGTDAIQADDTAEAAGFPRDLDALKEELARHLEGLRRERSGEPAPGEDRS